MGAVLQAGLLEEQGGVSSKLRALRKVRQPFLILLTPPKRRSQVGSGGGSLSFSQPSAPLPLLPPLSPGGGALLWNPSQQTSS